jgi:hypothetical protein
MTRDVAVGHDPARRYGVDQVKYGTPAIVVAAVFRHAMTLRRRRDMSEISQLEHGIYASGIGGLVELTINVLTLGLSAWFLSWPWRRRGALLASS